MTETGSSAADSHKTAGRNLATGGAILAIATAVANAGNYLLNVILARWLTPSEFADANLMVTLLLLVTALAVGLQLVTAKFTGTYAVEDRPEEISRLYRRLVLLAGAGGAVLGGALVVAAPLWRDFFRSESAWPFVILGLGLPCYLALSVGRGVLQGELQFRPLAFTFIVEMVVRLVVAVAMVALGFGVSGATFGLAASFVVTWMHATYLVGKRWDGTAPAEFAAVVAYARPVGLLLLAQIIINNSDVLVAKRFLDGNTAGVYAAVALAGRAVFFLSWSVATTLFPAVVQRSQSGQDSSRLLWIASGVVLAIGLSATAGAALLGDVIMATAIGPEYGGTSGPLATYALATTLFAVANLAATFHLSTGRVREAWLLLAGGVLQFVLLIAGRDSISSLVQAQLVAMTILLVAVLAAQRVGGGGLKRVGDTPIEGRKRTAATDALELIRRTETTSRMEGGDSMNQSAADNPDAVGDEHESEGVRAAAMDSYRSWASRPLPETVKYSVVIPAYNEEWRIVPTIGAVAAHMSSLGEPWELIVSDDGSSDRTVEIIERLNLAGLRLLQGGRNMGKGAAVRRGVLESRGDVILFADADQSTPIQQFELLERKINEGYSVVVGSRAAEGSSVANKSLKRRVFSAGLAQLVRLGLGLPLHDTQCGFKMFTRTAAHEIFSRQRIDGFSFDLEILYLARKFNFDVAEVGIHWYDSPGSKVDALAVARKFIGDLADIRRNDRHQLYDRPLHPIPAKKPVASARPAPEPDEDVDAAPSEPQPRRLWHQPIGTADTIESVVGKSADHPA